MVNVRLTKGRLNAKSIQPLCGAKINEKTHYIFVKNFKINKKELKQFYNDFLKSLLTL